MTMTTTTSPIRVELYSAREWIPWWTTKTTPTKITTTTTTKTLLFCDVGGRGRP